MTFNFSFLHGVFVCPSYLVALLLLQVSERTNCSTPYERHLTTLFQSQAALNVSPLLYCGMTLVLTYVVWSCVSYNVPSHTFTYDFATARFMQFSIIVCVSCLMFA